MRELKRDVRERTRPLKVYVTASERLQITASAADAGMSVSDYLRALGIAFEPKSVFDRDAISALAKVHADQGRLGGLLKLWLSERPGQGSSEYDIGALLAKLHLVTDALLAQVRRL